ncbi:MAG: gliding motility protein GldN [Bacteroidota bacterium]
MNTMTLKRITFLLISACLVGQGAVAQVKRKAAPAKKTTAKPAPKKPAAETKVLDASISPAQADTVKPIPPAPKDPFAFDSIKVSLRPDAVIERGLIKSRSPLVYEHIREDDAWYRERIWREIDIREKMNLPFRYKAEDDNGNQRFINILLRAVKKGDVTAFDPTVDDRFTTPMTLEKVGSIISGKCDSIQVMDWAKDPTGTKGFMKDSLVCKDFNPDEIVKFRIKEEWVFDKEASRMFTRILGIAPVKTYVDENTGTVLGESPIFWVYYPDLRPVLSLYEVYNGKNFGARMSWEELFESRFFASYVIKSSSENPYDMFVKEYVKDNILRLLEGENIKSRIFNFEQDLWSY